MPIDASIGNSPAAPRVAGFFLSAGVLPKKEEPPDAKTITHGSESPMRSAFEAVGETVPQRRESGAGCMAGKQLERIRATGML